MNKLSDRSADHATDVFEPGAIPAIDSAARARLVNRTHRVVRERAQTLQSRRSRVRSLWIPMVVCAVLLLASSVAVWTMLDQYELAPTGIPDASAQMMVMLLWFLPVSAALLAMVWFRKTRSQSGDEFTR